MAEKVPVFLWARGCAREPQGEQVLCPLVSCCMLERICHRRDFGCQEGVPIWFPLVQCVW